MPFSTTCCCRPPSDSNFKNSIRVRIARPCSSCETYNASLRRYFFSLLPPVSLRLSVCECAVLMKKYFALVPLISDYNFAIAPAAAHFILINFAFLPERIPNDTRSCSYRVRRANTINIFHRVRVRWKKKNKRDAHEDREKEREMKLEIK